MRYKEEPFGHAFEGEEAPREVDHGGDVGRDDLNGETTRNEEIEEEINPCPMCGGRHKGSYCQMPPHEIDYVS